MLYIYYILTTIIRIRNLGGIFVIKSKMPLLITKAVFKCQVNLVETGFGK